MREAVLVTEHVAGRPPGGDVRMRGLGHEDPREALPVVRRGAVVELESVEVFQVEGDRALGARHLDPQRVLAAGGETGRLEAAEHTRIEAAREHRDVVDGGLAGARAGGSPEARDLTGWGVGG